MKKDPLRDRVSRGLSYILFQALVATRFYFYASGVLTQIYVLCETKSFAGQQVL